MEERALHGVLKCVHLCRLYYCGFELIGVIQLRGLADLPGLQLNQPLHLLHTVYVHDNLRRAGEAVSTSVISAQLRHPHSWHHLARGCQPG